MNKKSFVLVFILYGLILAALIAKNGELLLLAMPFLVYLIVGIVQAPDELKLDAERNIDKTSAIAEQAVATQVVINNQGKHLLNLHLSDMLNPSIRILDGQAQNRLSLPTGKTPAISYKFSAKRGVYSWKTIQACASDPLGLFELKREIPAAGALIVVPTPMKTRPVLLKPRQTLHSPGPIPARQAGTGIDFWGIREYRPGDTLRQLNWRLMARHPKKLFTNEYERYEVGDFGLILDARQLTNTDVMENALFENSVRAAASLSESFLKNGNRVSMLVYGKPISTVFPGYGKKHLEILLRNLANAKLGAYIPFTYLEYFPTRLFPARSIIVIFSRVDSRDLEVYARLRAYDYDVLLISPDPVEYVSRMSPSTEINRLATRAARVERVVQLKVLLKLGVKVIDWQVDKPLESVIHKTVDHLIHRRSIHV